MGIVYKFFSNYFMYSYRRKLNKDFDTAFFILKEKLGKKGFGLLTQIDVQATLKKKIGVDWDRYLILGVCNPELAYQALQKEYEVGLLLPCKMILYERKGEVYLSMILPSSAMGIVGNPALEKLALKVQDMMQEIVDAV